MGLVKDKKLNGIGMSTKKRVELLPEVPTIAEQGLYDYEMTLWFGMWAPAATPIPIVQKLNAAINAIVLEPVVKEQFAKLGIEAAPMKTDEFGKFVREQMAFYRKIVQAAGIPQQ
jgi:tripartite-type tricarboxylate transporter receptor subunit TctC